jgi:hypothetical protein
MLRSGRSPRPTAGVHGHVVSLRFAVKRAKAVWNEWGFCHLARRKKVIYRGTAGSVDRIGK